MARRSRTYVELAGQEGMRRAFVRLEFAALARVTEQIKNSAEVIERDAKAGVLVGEGTTRDSIRTIYRDKGTSASIGSGYFNARFIEQGTQREPAHPFLNPAFQHERPHFIQGVEDALNDAGRDASEEGGA